MSELLKNELWHNYLWVAQTSWNSLSSTEQMQTLLIHSFTPTHRTLCDTQRQRILLIFFCCRTNIFMSSFTERESELIQPHKYAETIKNFIHYDVVVGNLSTQQQIIWHLCCNLSLTLLIANEIASAESASEFSHHFPKWDFILLKLNDSILLNEVNHTGTSEREREKKKSTPPKTTTTKPQTNSLK